MKIVITRHKAFVEYLLLKRIIKEGEYRVIPHASPQDLKDKEVITSGLPLHLAALCRKVTIVALNLPPEKRGKELALEDMKKYAIGIKSYTVKEVVEK